MLVGDAPGHAQNHLDRVMLIDEKLSTIVGDKQTRNHPGNPLARCPGGQTSA